MQHALVGNTATLAEFAHVTSQCGPCLLDCGSRLGMWRNKCLQIAVLRMCNGSQTDDVRVRLLQACRNNRGAGLAGGIVEATNFHSVAEALRCSGKRVRVLDVQCKDDFWNGGCLGVWNMGEPSGTVLGTLVWCRSDRHVFVVKNMGTQSWSDACESCGGSRVAPWFV